MKETFLGVKKKYLTPAFLCSILIKSCDSGSGGKNVKACNLTVKNTQGRDTAIGLEKLEYKGMLYDFYGELLTQHQKKVYEDAVFNDLSLSEIADEQGISRQGVHDLIRRCDKILNDYEDKLHLVEKFSKIKNNIREINSLTDDERIKNLSNEIIEEL